eukprot:SAG25_NODE_337_length_9543_cov_4.171961_16_plen_130_part_00
MWNSPHACTHPCRPVCTQSKGTALYFAALNDHLDVVNLLIERNADVNVKTHSGQTPLHVAQSPAVADAVLAAGCDCTDHNKVRNIGVSAVMVRVTHGVRSGERQPKHITACWRNILNLRRQAAKQLQTR